MEELLKALNENKALGEKLKKLWQEKASAADIVALLKEEGLDVDMAVVEEVLEKAQKELAGKVALEKLDNEAIATVAGGEFCGNISNGTGVINERCLFTVNCDVTTTN